MTIKFVVAGTGWVAGEYCRCIAAHPDAEVYGVVSRDPDRARSRLAEWGIRAKAGDSFVEMIDDDQVDAVVLCSTPDVRPQQAIAAARLGKHLVIEKPVALDPLSLRHMAEAISRHGVKTVVSFVLRWNPMFDLIRSAIDQDALGRIFMAQIDYWHNVGPQYEQFRWSSGRALGGSSILSAGCHAVDALRYFAGEVDEVYAAGCRTRQPSPYEFDPNVIAVMKLGNGGVGKVSSSLECVTTFKYNVHLLGENGSMLNNRLYTSRFAGQTDYADIPTSVPDSGDVADATFQREIEDFIGAIRDGTTTRCDFFDAYRTMEVCFAIDESAATGQIVRLRSES